MTTAQQIHKEFRTSLDKSTLRVKELPTLSKSLPILEKIGATKSKNYIAIMGQRQVQEGVAKHNDVINALLSIETKFPEYRIIDMHSVMALMEKYKLAMGYIGDYMEAIPDVNQQNIADYIAICKVNVANHNLTTIVGDPRNYSGELLIVAPPNFFDKKLVHINGFMCRMERPKLNFKIEYPDLTDPIVLNPLAVNSENRQYFHIVDAWDLEADDAAVSNNIAIDNHSTN